MIDKNALMQSISTNTIRLLTAIRNHLLINKSVAGTATMIDTMIKELAKENNLTSDNCDAIIRKSKCRILKFRQEDED